MYLKILAKFLVVVFAISTAHAATQRVLYAFTGGLDGGQPYAGVIQDAQGNLYGVTESGGLYNKGTVFELTPSSEAWTETVLYNFSGPDGWQPVGGLALDEAGNLYGTTSWGGNPSLSCGTVFQLSPSGSSWELTVLHTFMSGKDGCAPLADLTYNGGMLSGATAAGGRANQGTVFRMSSSGANYVVTSFTGNNGNQPFGGVNPWNYGTTSFAGNYRGGNVYEWCCGKIMVKHTFNPTAKFGYDPMGDLLTWNPSGTPMMIGTNSRGGVGGHGTAYKLTASPTKYDVWLISLLYSFSGPDGDTPGAGLVIDASGNLYGTTTWGGTNPGYGGTVFKLTPGAKNKWSHTTLYNFSGGTDGAEVTSGVILDSNGNLYGTTLYGGASGQGVVYEVIP